jgi:hypothetical protein
MGLREAACIPNLLTWAVNGAVRNDISEVQAQATAIVSVMFRHHLATFG